MQISYNVKIYGRSWGLPVVVVVVDSQHKALAPSLAQRQGAFNLLLCHESGTTRYLYFSTHLSVSDNSRKNSP